MKKTQSLKYYCFTLLIIVILASLFSFVEIYSCWTQKTISISQFKNIDLSSYTTLDKVVTTLYLILDITLLVPAIWFYKICHYETGNLSNRAKLVANLLNINTSF